MNDVLENAPLPIMEEPYTDDPDGKPFVYILPVTGDYSGSPSNWEQNFFYIVENRRAINADSYINRFSHHDQEKYGDTEGSGGYVIWEHRSGGGNNLRVVEADNRYDITSRQWGQNSTGSPRDFWNNAMFASWTAPGDYTIVVNSDGLPRSEYRERSATRGKPVLAKFPEYSTGSNVNTVTLLSTGGRFTGTVDATRYNNQRKLASNGSDLLLAHETGDENGVNRRVFVSMSTNSGVTWGWCELVSSIAFTGSPAVMPYAPRDASAPSVCWIGTTEKKPWVAWQEYDAGTQSWKVLAREAGQGAYATGAKLIADSIQTNTGVEPTPVIACGYNQSGNCYAKIVFATSSGLKESITTDLGANWSAPSVIASTDGNSIRPSLAMYWQHSILVYEQVIFTTEQYNKLYYSIDGNPVSCLTDNVTPRLYNHSHPCVELKGTTAHVVWTASIVEESDSEDEEEVHRKAVHTEWNIDFTPSSSVTTFFNRKYNRSEVSEDPVTAAFQNPGTIKDADIIWSVNDLSPGARLRGNKYRYNPATNKHEWTRDRESALSTLTTRYPAMVGLDNETRSVVTRGSASPFRIVSNLTSIDPGIQSWSGQIIDVITSSSTSQNPGLKMTLAAQEPEVLDGGIVTAVLKNAGIPDSGFDGRLGGPNIFDLMKTESYILDQNQSILWNVDLVLDSSYQRMDTLIIVGRMIEVQSGQTVGSSNPAEIPMTKFDTSLVFGFELPPGLYPQAEISLTLEVLNGQDMDADRFIHAMINIQSDTSATPKRLAPGSKPALTSAFDIHIAPNPLSSEVAYLQFTATSTERVRIEVYDLLGRMVSLLMDGTVQKGNFSLPVFRNLFRTGSYFIKVSSQSHSETAHFTVVR